MVATVLKLRYRVLGNTLARRPWQLVGFCLGMLGALWMLGLAVAGLVALGFAGDPELSRTLVVLAGSVLIAGWVIGPLLVAGTDTTVDAAQLAPFPFSLRQLMLALAGAGLTGIPGIASTLAAVATAVVWVRWPAAAVIAVPAAVIGVLIAVVASRLVATLSRGLGAGRRGREIIGTVVLGAMIMAGPIVVGILSLIGDGAGGAARVRQVAEVLGWTPLGAAWAVPADVATGQWLPAIARLGIAAATLAVLWLVWARALDASVTAPPRAETRAVKPGALGLFAVMPTGGVGATWARSLTAWLRDPRYLRQLIFVPLFPALFAFTGGVDGFLFSASAVIVAFILAIAGYADISYDGTAFAAVLSTGVRGRADRWGRVLGAASVGVPAVVVVAVVTAALGGAWAQLPAVLGAALGLLLVGYGVSAVSSALLVVPVASAGDSPFKSVPGQTFLNGLTVLVVWAACTVLAAPPLVLGVLSVTRSSTAMGLASLAVGVVWGVAVIVAGTVVGGRTLDRTGPDLLARIKAFPT